MARKSPPRPLLAVATRPPVVASQRVESVTTIAPKRAVSFGRVLLYVALVFGAVISLVPFYWMFVSATHPSSDVLKAPPNLLPGSDLFNNIAKLWDPKGSNFGRVMLNSAFIAVSYTLLAVLVCSLAGYAFAKFTFRGRNIVFFLFLATLMIPAQVTYVPLYKLMASWHWLNTYQAVILPTVASPFGIFLMRQSMRLLPTELMEAARIDGAGEIGIYSRIAMPVMGPSLAALSIFMFMSQWNNFFWPLVVMQRQDMYTIPVSISSQVGFSIVDYGAIMTGTSLAVLPLIILFLSMQRQFISGALAGSVKG